MSVVRKIVMFKYGTVQMLGIWWDEDALTG